MFKFDSTTEKVLEILKEEGIWFSDILTYYIGILEFKRDFQYESERMLENVETLFRLPKKKKEKLRKKDEAAFNWLMRKLAKSFYKKLGGLNYKIVDFLKESTLLSFAESVEKECYLDSEESLDGYIKANHYTQILVLYLVIQILFEKPELREQLNLLQENTEKWKINIILSRQIEKNEKMDIATKFIQDIVINFAPLLYMENRRGEEKLSSVLGPVDLTETEMEYLKELEEETLKTYEEKLQERQEYSQTVDELQRELSKKEEKIRKLEEELGKYKRLAEASDSLKEAKVLVIGDTRRKEYYREIIKKYDGEFKFLDGYEDHALAKEKAEAADIVFHITAHSSHSVHFQIRNFNNIVYVNNAGVLSLEQAVRSQLVSNCDNCGSSLH